MADRDASPLICIVDDDAEVRDSLDNLLRSSGYKVRSFAAPQELLASDAVEQAACLILDVRLRDVNGLDFQQELIESKSSIPVVLLSGFGDVPSTVRGMRAGAVTFLTKPFDDTEMLAAIEDAVARDQVRRTQAGTTANLRSRFEALTPREIDLFRLVTAGLMNKQIAAHLGLSEITVKIHRGNMMRKMVADSLADLVRMAEALGIQHEVSRYNRG